MSDEQRSDTTSVRWPLGLRAVAGVGVAFAAVVLLLNRAVRAINSHIAHFDCPSYWPLGLFRPRLPSPRQIALAAGVAALFYGFTRGLRRLSYRLGWAIAAALALLFLSNSLQGWEDGFRTPIAGGGVEGIQCYHDAMRIERPLEFVRRFEENQPKLLVHARTHPPGAVLSIYLMRRLLGAPAAIAAAIAIISALLTAFFLYGLLASEFGAGRFSGYLVFLFMLIPSIQIYYLASIDALIASLLLGAAYFFLRPRTAVSIVGMVVCTFLASFMTFGFLFILPVVVVTELLADRRLLRSGVTIAIVAAIYLLVDRLLGFNYIASFRTAVALENPRGFMLLADPASYVFTRLEGITEIIVFFGPFLGILALRGFRLMKLAGGRLPAMAVVGLWTIVAMLLTGAFRTGETARCCIFIYPYLMIPAAYSIRRAALSPREETILCSVVFAQAVGMQLFGRYFW